VLALLDLTQHVVLVASPDLSAVKSSADAIDILMQLGTPHDRLTVVLNNRVERPAVSRSAVERLLGREVDIEVGYDGTRPDKAAVDGAILSLTDPRSAITRATDTLAAALEAKHGAGAKAAAATARREDER
jgi:pilus assembly protein CpaE